MENSNLPIPSEKQQEMLDAPKHIQYETVKRMNGFFWKDVKEMILKEGLIVSSSLHPANIKGDQNIRGALESYEGFVLIGNYHKTIERILDQIDHEGFIKNIELFIIFYFQVLKEKLDSIKIKK